MNYTSKEIIRRVIEFDKSPRIGYDFKDGINGDLFGANLTMKDDAMFKWQKPEFFKDEFPQYKDFDGFLKKDEFMNLHGKMSHDLTGGGEVLIGAMQSWDNIDDYIMPDFDNPSRYTHLEEALYINREKFSIGWVMGFPFAFMRKMRKMDQFLMDLILDKENVLKLRDKVVKTMQGVIENYGQLGADGIFFCEDWGVQDRLLISPKLFREIFKPAYITLCNTAKKYNMKIFMHSCGFVEEILEDLIEVGIDVFQFDQPNLMGLERLSEIIGNRATLYSPADIQVVLPSENIEYIEENVEKMVKLFYKNGGGLIAKDYGDYRTIGVKQQYVECMRAKFMELGGSK